MRNHPDAGMCCCCGGREGAGALTTARCVGAGSFLQPVSLREYPDYVHFVSRPMDLSTLWKKIHGDPGALPGTYSGYTTLASFRSDMEQIFNNCDSYCRDRYPTMPPVRAPGCVVPREFARVCLPSWVSRSLPGRSWMRGWK